MQERTAQARQAQAEAEAQRARLRKLLLQAPALIASLRGSTHVVELVNDNFQRLFGTRQLVGKPYAEALFELVDQQLIAVLDSVYRTGQTFTAREKLIYLDYSNTGQLEAGYFDFIWQPTHEAEGQVSGILVFAFDVSEQVQARQALEASHQQTQALAATLAETNQQLTRTNVDLDTFVYTASHDLKAPITNIEGILLALRETLPTAVQQDEVTAHLLTLLEQTTARFQVTIGQLTDLSKLQLAYAAPPEPVPLAAVIESVRLDLAPIITAADVQLTVEVTPDLVVSFPPANLRSAVYNLLSNAVKYRAPNRPAQVRVRASSAGPRVMLEVEDNGLGLNVHQQSRLFGLFQRLHTHVEGTGVGLYTTKRLVENGGGTIAVASQVDVGTTFTLTFPA